ncbi:MAG: 2-amino-4-hydroxy-6-hydroxymethyldihydropteridine diphosphokinase [Bacteroidota bacterium]
MKEIFILLGSNRGERGDFLLKSREMISVKAGSIVKASAVYETQPWGFEDPVPFLNQVVEIETEISPSALLELLLAIEAQLGRIRPFDSCGCSDTYSGRTIDLDILFYGQRLIFTDNLMIPHPRLHERRFTLVPLNEIAPGFTHPLLKRTISSLLQECTDKSVVETWEQMKE